MNHPCNVSTAEWTGTIEKRPLGIRSSRFTTNAFIVNWWGPTSAIVRTFAVACHVVAVDVKFGTVLHGSVAQIRSDGAVESGLVQPQLLQTGHLRPLRWYTASQAIARK